MTHTYNVYIAFRWRETEHGVSRDYRAVAGYETTGLCRMYIHVIPTLYHTHTLLKYENLYNSTGTYVRKESDLSMRFAEAVALKPVISVKYV